MTDRVPRHGDLREDTPEAVTCGWVMGPASDGRLVICQRPLEFHFDPAGARCGWGHQWWWYGPEIGLRPTCRRGDPPAVCPYPVRLHCPAHRLTCLTPLWTPEQLVRPAASMTP